MPAPQATHAPLEVPADEFRRTAETGNPERDVYRAMLARWAGGGRVRASPRRQHLAGVRQGALNIATRHATCAWPLGGKHDGESPCRMDAGVGRVEEALRRAGMWQDTLLVFSSDNGGAVSMAGSNHPLRGTKGTLFEVRCRGA